MHRYGWSCVLLGLMFALGVGGCGDERTVETDGLVGTDTTVPDTGPGMETAPDGAADAPSTDLRADAILTDGFTTDAGPGTTCQTAIPIPLQNNKGQATGEIKATDTDNSVTLKNTDCVGAITSGADRFYSVSLAAGQLYIISVEGQGSFTPALYVFGECSDPGASCLAGGGGTSNLQQVAVTPTKSGIYYIGVDSTLPMGLPGSYGQYTVTVTDGPENDTCAKATALSWSGTTASVSGSLVGATNASTFYPGPTTCGGTPMMPPAGPDLFYALSVTAGKGYKVTLQPDSTFDAMVYVFTSCSNISGTCLAGFDEPMPGSAETVSFGVSQTGTVYIAVDASQTPTGSSSFTLTVEEFSPPANDQCSTATALTLTAGKATATGDTSQAFDSTGQTFLSCSTAMPPTPAPGPDLFYSLTPTAGKGYKVTLTSTAYDLMAYVFTSCSNISGSCVAATGGYIGPGQTQTASFVATSGATHYIAVDSYNSFGGGGPFTLEVEEFTPPANDQCSGATALTPTAGKATVTGDTSQAFDSTGQSYISCSASMPPMPAPGPDLFYSLTPTVGQAYKVSLTANFYDAVAYVITNCSNISGTCIAATAGFGTPGQKQSVSFIATSSSTHTIVVDSLGPMGGGGGTFTLEVEEYAPPTNSTCASPETMTWSGGKATASSDTSLSSNDLNNVTCYGYDPFDGPQLYYKVALTQGKQYIATLTVDPNYDGALYAFPATTACTSTAVNAACANSYSNTGYTGMAEILGLNPTTGGDWILVVDSPMYGGTGGFFTLTVEEATAPSNDTCAGATTITIPSTGYQVTVTGHTMGATDTVNLPTTGCTGNTTAGPDVFYKIQLNANQYYYFNLMSSFNAAIYVFTDCTSVAGTCTNGSDMFTGSGNEMLDVIPTTTQTYLLAVDGRTATDTGTFTIDIATKGPIPPPPPPPPP